MSASRTSPPKHPVTVYLDGDPIVAEEGEPIAQALIAADRVALARSPKLHRPRGPSCFRGGCDGCLARLDGIPNVMTCLRPAAEGARVETQNVLGTRTIDLLQVTDWFFPDGIDHHHLLAGVPGLSPIMQTMARRIAGLGTLPDAARPISRGARRTTEGDDGVDVVVVGAGPSGIATASVLARNKQRVVLIDDAVEIGGSARALGSERLNALLAEYPLDGVEVLTRSVAAGIYEGDVLVVGPVLAQRLHPYSIVLATGAHDGAPLIEGNDLPGVYSARAAAMLAASGVRVGQRVCVIGEGPFAQAFIDQATTLSITTTRVSLASVVKLDGSSRVGAVVTRNESGKETKLRVDAVVIDMPGAPSFELCEQTGASVRYVDPRGFVPVAKERPHAAGAKIAENVWAVGELMGVGFDPALLAHAGQVVAAQVIASR
ncbi:MAG: 2Fe-2S iron-sulfur cluster-binding protein [Polyangiaceae bacterium]